MMPSLNSSIPSIEQVCQCIRPIIGANVTLSSLGGKTSGLVYATRGSHQDWVIKLEPQKRHSLAKIHGFLARHPEIRAPRVHSCVDIGQTPWRIIVMEKCPGTPADQLFETAGQSERQSLIEALVEILCTLHQIRFEQFGLFNEEGKIFRAFGSRKEHLHAKHQQALARHRDRIQEDTRVAAIFSEAALAMSHLEGFAEQEPVLVHGDFKMANVIVESLKPVRLWILDWEWSRAYEAAYDCCRILTDYHESEDLCRWFWLRFQQRTQINPRIVACYLTIECFLHVDWALNEQRALTPQVMHFAKTFPNIKQVHAWLRSLAPEVP